VTTRAITIPAEAILSFLRARGFVERVPVAGTPAAYSTEIVYERAHKIDRRYRVVVYTSIRKGAAVARGVGKDAIRVCAIYDDGATTRGLGKWPRVHRTGSVDKVLARMLERMRLAYERCCEARPKLVLGHVVEQPISRHVGEDQIAVAFEQIDARFDCVQQKHHPGSMLRGHERVIGDWFPEDDLGGEEP
jgi:hypothetical protein